MKNFLIILGLIMLFNVNQYASAGQEIMSMEEAAEALRTADESLNAAKNNLINAEKTLKKAQKDNKAAIIAQKKIDAEKIVKDKIALKKQKKQDRIKQTEPKTAEQITAEKIAIIQKEADKKVAKIQEKANRKAAIAQAKKEEKLADEKANNDKKIAFEKQQINEKNLARQKKIDAKTLIAQKRINKQAEREKTSKELPVSDWSNKSKKKFKPVAQEAIPAVKLADDFVVAGDVNYADNKAQIIKLLSLTDKQQKNIQEVFDSTKAQIASLNAKISDKEQEIKIVKLSRISIELQNEKLKKINLELNNLYLERDREHNSALRKFDGFLNKEQKDLWEDMKKQGAKFFPDVENIK